MSKNSSNLLVVGGTGFIGKHVCNAANELGFSVTSLSLRKAKSPIDGVAYLYADLRDRQDVCNTLSSRKFNYIVNCGGYIDHSPYFNGGNELIETHFIGLKNLIDCLDRSVLKRFVNLGSSDEYGDSPAPQSELLREAPISPYSFAKVAATHFLQTLWLLDNFPAVTLRLFLVYGPGQGEKRFLPQIIKGCLNNDSFPVSAGSQLRDFCYIEDIVEGILKSFEVPDANGKVLNLASGEAMSIKSVIEKVQNLVGSGDPRYGEIPYREGENMQLWADTTSVREILSWSPKVSLADGLKETIKYYPR